MPLKKASKKLLTRNVAKKATRSLSAQKPKAIPRSARAKKQDLLLRAVQRRAAKGTPVAKIHQLERHDNNPILSPRQGNYWEMKATFNPGAVYADKRVHLLYRAIGSDDISVLGYASSIDGATFFERPTKPAYAPFVIKKDEKKQAIVEPINAAYFSGGGWNGGVEDPRLTLIEDTIYLTYTAFDGWGSVRIALSSIKLKDFKLILLLLVYIH